MCKLCQSPDVTEPVHLAFNTPPPSIFTRRKGESLGYDIDEDRRRKLPQHKRNKAPPKNPNRCNILLFVWVCIKHEANLPNISIG